MKVPKCRRIPRTIMRGVVFCILGWIGTQHVQAQLPGDKASYASSQAVGPFHDYIDASVFVTGTGAACSLTDVCCAIAQSLTQLQDSNNPYKSDGIVDARGILPGPNLSCSSSPWTAAGSFGNVSATVLLPAGTIPISASWVLPQNTRLIGEGALSVNAAGTMIPLTTIQAATGFTGDMIDMGDPQGSTANTLCNPNASNSPPNCTGISIEHLTLDGNSVSGINGIVNAWAQEFNYVNDVALLNISGTGLAVLGENFITLPPMNIVQGDADNSGPYSNIYFSGSGTCINIHGTYGTRGIYGLTCNSTTASTSAAITIDGSNNTIQDVYISGYKGDGILIGSQGYASDNLIFSVVGDANVKNLIHISNSFVNNQPDVTLLGIKSGANTTVLDDFTGSRLNDGTIGVYILGESLTPVQGYSRFTTSSFVPAWFVGPLPTAGSSCTGTVLGSLYSVNTGSTGPTLWACVVGTSGGVWQSLSTN